MPLQNHMSPKPLSGRGTKGTRPVVKELGRPGAYCGAALVSTRCDRNAAHPWFRRRLPILPDGDGQRQLWSTRRIWKTGAGRWIGSPRWSTGKPPRSTGPNVVITHAGQPRRIRPPHPAVAPLGAGPSRFCEHLLRPREGEFYRIPTERELEEQRGPLS